nr:serpin-Z1C-like [Ziziphus jujuba var. spinosa]
MENSPQSNTNTLFNTDFCLHLTNLILENEASKGSNFVASPLSLHVMLSLITAGTKGQTLQQLFHFLGSTSINDLNLSSSKIINLASLAENLAGGPLLSFVNGAWIDRRLTEAEQVVEEVNLWVEVATKGLIKQLLPGRWLDRETVFALANALYFKGAWDFKFDPSMTEQRDFHLLNGQIVQVSFMSTQRYILHKSYIEVNEEGTEAAASTAVRGPRSRASIPSQSFVADHPFLFMIREETLGIIFFVGAVLNPLLDA